jgi:hypothetical protein
VIDAEAHSEAISVAEAQEEADAEDEPLPDAVAHPLLLPLLVAELEAVEQRLGEGEGVTVRTEGDADGERLRVPDAQREEDTVPLREMVPLEDSEGVWESLTLPEKEELPLDVSLSVTLLL